MSKWKTEGAWVQVKWKPGSPQNAWKAWEGNSSVKSGWTTSGDWDCKLWVSAKNPEEVEKFVWDHVRKNEWVKDTQTTWAWQWA